MRSHTFTSPLYLLVIGGCALTIGDILAAQLVKTGTYTLYLPVMTLYLLGLMLLVKSYEKEDISVASTILVVFNISILSCVGVLFFGEKLVLTKIIGLVLGLFSVYLLEIGKNVCIFEHAEKK